MGLLVTRTDLNNHCKLFQDAFSDRENAQSIQNYAFPRVTRQPAEKCHDTAVYLQKGSRCPVIHNGEQSDVVATRKELSKAQVKHYSTPEGIIELNKEGIELAVERRVSLFLQQSILCHGMSSFVFSARGADDQIGTAPAMDFSSKTGASVTHKREAAHSSTIPTLIAHAKDGSTPAGFVYLKGGSSHDQHNATIGMHIDVNGADELIDGSGQDGKLRDRAVRILNLVADGLDPVKSTIQFLGAYDACVLNEREQLQKKEKNGIVDGRKLVLDLYHRKIQAIQLAAKDKSFFDYLIGVVISPGDKDEANLRDIVYKKRYAVIQHQEVIESRIGKKIADVRETFGKTERSFLEYILLKEFANTKQHQFLEKLFGKTDAIFESDYGKNEDGTFWITDPQKRSLKTFRTRVANVREKNSTAIQNLARDMRADFRTLIRDEFSFRAGVFRDLLKKVRNWTGEKFCSEYLKKTGQRVSQAWVSRMGQLDRVPTKMAEDYKTPVNQRRRYVTVQDAENCALTFGVHAGIFLPCLFTS